jgi:hypothetical protein
VAVSKNVVEQPVHLAADGLVIKPVPKREVVKN